MERKTKIAPGQVWRSVRALSDEFDVLIWAVWYDEDWQLEFCLLEFVSGTLTIVPVGFITRSRECVA